METQRLKKLWQEKKCLKKLSGSRNLLLKSSAQFTEAH
jgi:hypothetical protein